MISRKMRKIVRNGTFNKMEERMALSYEEKQELYRKEKVRKVIHDSYNRTPPKRIRGIFKTRRDVCYYGASNGTLCLACLRRFSDLSEGYEVNDTCTYCQSKSRVFLGPKIRLPRRTASRRHWEKFVLEQKLVMKMPDDFMANV